MDLIVVQRWVAPVGDMMLGSIGEKICVCDWPAANEYLHGNAQTSMERRICRRLNAEFVEGSSPAIEELIAQLTDYFAGVRKDFSLPVQFAGTEFQCRVWAELMKIPYGTTISYAELARRIGRPRAVRAVASANANNPISILVPCHRVIGSNGKLTGYGGGLSIKKALLTLEKESLQQSLFYSCR